MTRCVSVERLFQIHCEQTGGVSPLKGSGLARLSRVYGSLSRESSFSWVSVSLEPKPPNISVIHADPTLSDPQYDNTLTSASRGRSLS